MGETSQVCPRRPESTANRRGAPERALGHYSHPRAFVHTETGDEVRIAAIEVSPFG